MCECTLLWKTMALQTTETKDNNTDQSKTSTSDSGYWTGKRAFKKKIDGETTYGKSAIKRAR